LLHRLAKRREANITAKRLVHPQPPTRETGERNYADEAWLTVKATTTTTTTITPGAPGSPVTNELVRIIPLDMFLNKEVKYPYDNEHLLATHKYYNAFSHSEYIEITADMNYIEKDLQLTQWCHCHNVI
jgi:hypothetical protein